MHSGPSKIRFFIEIVPFSIRPSPDYDKIMEQRLAL